VLEIIPNFLCSESNASNLDALPNCINSTDDDFLDETFNKTNDESGGDSI